MRLAESSPRSCTSYGQIDETSLAPIDTEHNNLLCTGRHRSESALASRA
jgi:hypothetical protein